MRLGGVAALAVCAHNTQRTTNNKQRTPHNKQHTTHINNTQHARSNIPYGFHHFPLAGLPPGFPVWLDINLSQGGAATWLAWLRDALLLDEATAGLSASFVTFNADLRVFALAAVDFEFGAGGSITVRAAGGGGCNE